MSSAPAAASSLDHASALSAEAASELFERHRHRVLSFCQSQTRNRTDAEDATQTTFMYALTGLKRGVVPEFELAWLLRIAANVCHSTRRRAHRRYERDELPLDVAGDRNGDPAVLSEHHATLSSALEGLPEAQRRAIVLREWHGLSYHDIAAQLQMSHAAVETLLFRARRSLAKRAASVAPIGLHIPSGERLARWLLGMGTAKATAVTATALTIGAAVVSIDVAPRLDAVPAKHADLSRVSQSGAPRGGAGSKSEVPRRVALQRAGTVVEAARPFDGATAGVVEWVRASETAADGPPAPTAAPPLSAHEDDGGFDPIAALPTPIEDVADALDPILALPEPEVAVASTATEATEAIESLVPLAVDAVPPLTELPLP